jgi:hypothetical protein
MIITEKKERADKQSDNYNRRNDIRGNKFEMFLSHSSIIAQADYYGKQKIFMACPAPRVCGTSAATVTRTAEQAGGRAFIRRKDTTLRHFRSMRVHRGTQRDENAF